MKHSLRMLSVILLGGLSWLPPLHALEVSQLQTGFHDGEYRLTMMATLAAPMARVHTVLRDYEHYPELDARILQAHVLNRSQLDQLQLLTRIKVCFAFICRTVQRVEQVQEQGDLLQARVLPEQSEGERGTTRTLLSIEDGKTQVSYETRIVPKFWVPAWVGRAWMLRSMQEATVSLFTRIEQRASQAP